MELWVAEEGLEEAEDEAVVALGGGPRLDVSQKLRWEKCPGLRKEGVGLLRQRSNLNRKEVLDVELVKSLLSRQL